MKGAIIVELRKTLTDNPQRALRAGAAGFFAGYALLTLSDAGLAGPLDVIEKHWVFHLFMMPAFAAFATGVHGLLRTQGKRIGKLGRFAAALVVMGTVVGTLAGLAVPALELGFGVETGEGALDALFHAPEFTPLMLGTLLLGVALFRSKAIARPLAALLPVSAILMMQVSAIPEGSLLRFIPLVVFGGAWLAVTTIWSASRVAPVSRMTLASEPR